MTTAAAIHREILRFGDFELDVAAYELRQSGRPVRLERQPMELLILLVQRSGRLVTRAEIIDKLWGKDVFVDVDTGVNTAARKIRQALEDSSDAPRFVETVPGKGYRFIAPVEVRPHVARSRAGLIRAVALSGLLIAVVTIAATMWLWVGSSTAVRRVTLAVLPFDNLSGDPEREYLAAGLTEDVISSIGLIDPERLAVVSRTSTDAYKRGGKPLDQIGDELGADYVVESSLRTESERVRITAKLIRVSDQVLIWSETYDRTMTSVLGLQSELSTAIAEQIRLRLTPERMAALARRHTRNPEAYDAYLRGLNASNQRTPVTNRQAIDYYRRATALDSSYALAWAGMSQVHAGSSINGDASPVEVLPLARDAARRALQADPHLAEAVAADAYVKWLLEWEWPAAEAGLRRAIVLDPSYPPAHRSLGHVLSQMGRHGEALVAMRRARELEPHFALAHALSAQVAFQARDHAAALEYARQAIVVEPTLWIGHMQAAQIYEQLGDQARALDELAKADQFSGQNSKVASLRGYVLAKAGRTAEAREAVRTLEQASHQRYVPPYAAALVHAALGDRGAVFEWLERAYAVRDVHLIFLPVDPKWDPYRSDPRFHDLLVRCGFVEQTARTGQSTQP